MMTSVKIVLDAEEREVSNERARNLQLTKGNPMNSNHRANVVRIDTLRTHPNADSLSLVDIDGYQVVVRTEEFQLGSLYVYIQPDSIVPQTEPFKFLWADKEFTDGVVPEKYRRVTVRRFRKEYSEGLLLPLSAFTGGLVHDERFAYGWVKEGDDVAADLGITHYEEPEPTVNMQGKSRAQYKTWPPRSFKGFFYWLMYKLGWDLNGQLGGDFAKPPKDAPPVYDVESLKNYPRLFAEGEQVFITEKIHGCNARFMFDGDKLWVGSHKLWKSEKSPCVWRRAAKEIPWIEAFCRAWPKFTLYGEVVPTQEGYDYGAKDGEVKFFAFDVRRPDGSYIAKPCLYKLQWEIGELVPVLYQGPYGAEIVATFAEGKSNVSGAKHIREGIVVTSVEERYVRGVGRVQLKLKSLAFLEKETK